MKKVACIIFSLSIFLNAIVIAQTIVIKSDTTKGCDKLSVNFSFSTSIFPVTSVKWDFGTGDQSTSASAMYIYQSPGSYNVKLVINGTDSVTKNNFINIGLTPKLQIIYKDTRGASSFGSGDSLEFL